MLMDEASRGQAKVEVLLEQMAAMRECTVPHVDALLAGLLKGTVTKSAPKVGAIDPSLLTKEEAAAIGLGFAKVLFRIGDPIEAVTIYVSAHQVLGAIEHELRPYFRPMVETIAARLLLKSPYGVWLRVGLGAGFSMADVGSDLWMIVTIFIAGNYASSAGLLATIILSLVLQSVVVIMARKRQGWRPLATELMVVWSCMKPPVDAYRVAAGSERDASDGQLPVAIEMVVAKVIEVVCEAIPGAWIQAQRLLTVSSSWTTSSILSIGFSLSASAFTSTLLAYELDNDKRKRREEADFYGYIPDEPVRQCAVFFLVLACSLIQVIAKVSAMALLSVASWQWFVGYSVADVGVFLLYMGLRGNFYYWIPGYGPILSLLARIIVKTMADYTGCLHLRHPLEMGGYFIVNSGLSFASCFMAIGVYAEYFTGENKLNRNTMFTVLGALTAAWLLAASVFATVIDRKYLPTFVSWQSGRQYAIRIFEENTGDDEARCKIFLLHEGLWAPIRGDVKHWVKGKYNGWKAASPAWFTEDLIARFPDDFIPVAALDLLKGSDGKRQSIYDVGIWDRTRGASFVSVRVPPPIASPAPTAPIAPGSVSETVSAPEVSALAPHPALACPNGD
jgi:hypothetical protein